DAGRAEILGELAPADDAVGGGQLDEVVVAPARVAGERLECGDFHERLPGAICPRGYTLQGNVSAAAAHQGERMDARSLGLEALHGARRVAGAREAPVIGEHLDRAQRHNVAVAVARREAEGAAAVFRRG